MNSMPIHPVATPPQHAIPQPVQPHTQATDRPVIAATRSESMAREARSNDDRSGGHIRRADTQGQPPAPQAGTTHDPVIGAILDVFA